MPVRQVRRDQSDTASAFLGRTVAFLLGAAFLLSGAAALIYEAVWQREFTYLFGSSSSATAAVLASYFAGLGLGSFVAGRYISCTQRPLLVYAFLELVIATSALLVPVILSLYSNAYPELFRRFQGQPSAFLFVKGCLAFCATALPTMAMGATLPVLAQLLRLA